MRARRLADGLYRAGLRSHDRVSVISANRPEFVDLYGACEWAGYVISPLNTELAAPEIAFILNDAEPRILVFERRFAAHRQPSRSTAIDRDLHLPRRGGAPVGRLV